MCIYTVGRNKNKIALFKFVSVIPVLVELLQVLLIAILTLLLSMSTWREWWPCFRTPMGKWETRCRI